MFVTSRVVGDAGAGGGLLSPFPGCLLACLFACLLACLRVCLGGYFFGWLFGGPVA